MTDVLMFRSPRYNV